MYPFACGRLTTPLELHNVLRTSPLFRLALVRDANPSWVILFSGCEVWKRAIIKVVYMPTQKVLLRTSDNSNIRIATGDALFKFAPF